MASEVQWLRAWRPGWLPWALLAVAWFATVPVRPMLDPDEGRYAEIPREMLVSGDWITPRFDGLKYFEKPPLQYWATAAVYSVAGVKEWSSRLWSAGVAFACLPLVFAWVRRRYGFEAGLVSLTALALSPFFGIVGHLNLLDAGLAFWLSCAVFAFTLAQLAAVNSAAERRWMLLAWGAAALAVLSKGIVVGVLAGAALMLYTLIERDIRTWRRLHALPGLVLFLVIAAPWFVVVSLRNPSFPAFFFVHEHFARFLTTVHQRVEPWWYFLPLLLLGALPWAIPLARACRDAWMEGAVAAVATAGAAPGFKPLRFLLVYAGVTLAFFSASGSKLAPYILPMFPVLAAITGAQVTDPERFMRRAARVAAGLIVFLAAGLLIYSARRNSFVPHEAIAWAGLALVAAGAGLVVTFLALRMSLATRALVIAAAAIVVWQSLLSEYTAIPPERSARELVVAMRPYVGAQTPLYSVGQYRETISPYLGRTLQLVDYEGELQFGLNEEPEKRMSLADFAARWSAGGAAVAFFDPGIWDSWRRRGLPGHVLAADSYTVAVGR
ncbi:MAG TPA: glycosyltransferase family 39 protein [Steroidobacteraceae bacterium]|jgi:4-amino-4-deoxy-L-arabinose transferase-like glycosyltransferase